MPIANTAKPTTSLTNIARVAFGVTWDAWTVSWATETRTWDELRSNIDSQSKPTATMTNLARP